MIMLRLLERATHILSHHHNQYLSTYFLNIPTIKLKLFGAALRVGTILFYERHKLLSVSILDALSYIQPGRIMIIAVAIIKSNFVRTGLDQVR